MSFPTRAAGSTACKTEAVNPSAELVDQVKESERI